MEGFFMIGIWIAILSGTLMSIQGVWNTQVTKQSSLWVSTGWVQLTAFLVCVAAWFFTGRDSVGILWQVENKYTLLGGILGTFITVTVIRSMGKLGPAQATMLIVIAQLVVSYLIEMKNSLLHGKNWQVRQLLLQELFFLSGSELFRVYSLVIQMKIG